MFLCNVSLKLHHVRSYVSSVPAYSYIKFWLSRNCLINENLIEYSFNLSHLVYWFQLCGYNHQAVIILSALAVCFIQGRSEQTSSTSKGQIWFEHENWIFGKICRINFRLSNPTLTGIVNTIPECILSNSVTCRINFRLWNPILTITSARSPWDIWSNIWLTDVLIWSKSRKSKIPATKQVNLFLFYLAIDLVKRLNN